jgi:hypothetical protein
VYWPYVLPLSGIVTYVILSQSCLVWLTFSTEQFALTETAYVMVRFLQRFDKLESTEKPGPPFFHYVFSNRSGTGVQVRLHEAAI